MVKTLDEQQPISLPEASTTSLPVRQKQPVSTQAVYLVLTATVFLLLGLLVATLFMNSNTDSVDSDELRQTVNEVVGTRIAELEPVSGGINREELDQMIQDAASTQAAIPYATPVPTLIPIANTVDDDPFLGPADAPVTIVEFSDFRCGYCGRWYLETLPRIREAYPDEVKFVYRDFPIFGEESVMGAMAAQCANEQGKFWEMHDYLFTQIQTSEVQFTSDALTNMAGDLGLDTDAFRECVTSARYQEEVYNDYNTARTWGFEGTPGFVINGVVYSFGAQPFAAFDYIIKAELDKANG